MNMSTENRAKAAVQKAEGKGQEVVGAVTGDSEDKAAGQAKQGAAKVREGIEDAKDNIADKAKQVADKVSDGIENAKDKLRK
jgi:uncharacterized protein YjbJ (UPF0337 family)